MEERNTHEWTKLLWKAQNIYLNRWHRTIKMSPNEAELPENQSLLRLTFHKFYSKYPIEKKPKYKVGDKVRIHGFRNIYTRGFYQSYTTEFFTIVRVKSFPLNRSRYYLRDIKGEILSAVFFENELSLFIPTKDTFYNIEKIIDERMYRGKKQYLIQWEGWPSTYNSWEYASNIINI